MSLAACTTTVPTSEPIPQPPPPPPVATAPLAPVESAPLVQAAPTNPQLAGKTDVAILLPLSGPLSGLGHDMLDAAQMAVIELGGDDLALTPKDTKGNAAGAEAAARAAIAEGARLIVGPLTASEAAAVKPVASAAGVNVLSFSTDASVAGGNVFIMGIRPQEEVRRIVGYARATGITQFAAVAPNTTYGQLVASEFQRDVTAGGGTVVDTEFFQPDGADIAAVLKHVSANGNPAFTALLIPEGAHLRSISGQLTADGIDPSKVRLLGTGVWDIPGLGTEPSLVGGWYAAPSPDARADFEKHFQQTYGRAPKLLAILSYDAVGLAAVLDRSPAHDFSEAALTNPSGFAGRAGVFRLHDDGLSEHGLAVLQVTPTGTQVVSPAPDSFAGGS